ncbi:hypothetical protein LZ198_35630 [Myxococcus sp. K15C18031901]|nr:hypothetical protein [Myxococcus dinghuensis]MCP3104208.1 hypothetical protein [Myxococcus dinghuensis]
MHTLLGASDGRLSLRLCVTAQPQLPEGFGQHVDGIFTALPLSAGPPPG